MKKFTIYIEETIVDSFEVIADDEEDAISKAIEKYNKGEFVLEPGEVIARQIAIDKLDEDLEFVEF